MHGPATLLLLFLVFASCKHGELTLEDLQKAKWDSLSKGIYYINNEEQKGITGKSDSLNIKIRGVSGKDINSFEMSFAEVPAIIKESLDSILKINLANSKSGYLKINFYDMLRPEILTARINLRGDYSGTFSFRDDSAVLIKIPGIVSARFISKEEAKKEYLADDGNQDWDKVLDVNPLPNNIEIVLEKKDWTEVSMKELVTEIKEKLVMASDVVYPGLWTKRTDDYFFFEYSWK